MIETSTIEDTSPALAIVTLNASVVDAAIARVEKFNRRAERAGIEGRYTTAVSITTIVTAANDLLGIPAEAEEVATFVVLGKPLVVEGQEFVATLSFDEEAGVITRPVPGATAVSLDRFRSSLVPVCDACNTARRRTDTYVLLEQATGALKVVGRNCLAAFIGLDPSGSIRALNWDADIKGDIEESLTGFSHVEKRIPASSLIAVASAVIAEWGWVSKGAAFDGREATASHVFTAFFPARTGKAAEADAAHNLRIKARLEADGGANRAVERAEEVIAWVRGDDNGLTGEYGENLQRILRADTVSTRNIGLAVSAVSAWAKAQDRAIEQAARKERAATSEFVGKEKERLDLALELVAQPRFIDGDFGVKTLLIFADEQGNAFKWWATGSHDYKVGTRFVGKATVKKHEEYNGAKSTVITRAKFDTV